MVMSLKDLLVNEKKIKLTNQEKLRIRKIGYILEVWRKIFSKVPVVVLVKDFSSDIPLSYILEIEVWTTPESFLSDEKFSDKVSIYVNEDIKILIGQHTFQNQSGEPTNVFDLWVKKYCPDYVFPEDFCLTKLLAALLCLEMMYKKFVTKPVNAINL